MSINQDTLFHDTTNQFCKYDKKLGTYTFILRAGKGTVSKALICMNEVELLMQYKKTKGGFDYFQTTLVLKNEPCRYHFKILNGGKVKFYNFFGTKDYLQEEGEFEITPGFITPDWAKGAVMYQIMVDRFCNGDTTNDVVDNEYAYIGRGVEAVKDWSENPATDGTRQFYGGDLQGVMDKMEYLRKLGVEVIYFNPIFVSPSNHKYDIQDYDYVDPHFGKIVKDGGTPIGQQESTNANADKYKIRTGSLENLEASNELFIKLVEKAHENNIKIIIDGVFNHCGSFNKWMDKEELYRDNANYAPGAYESKDSPYHSYFKFTDENDNNSYEGWWGFDTLPKLNYEGSEKLCKYILDIGKKWVSPPYNVDGWRLDVAADLSHSSEFNHKFWKKFRKVVKEANPNAIILVKHYEMHIHGC
ncbi:MAG: alpha-amylase family glycosyl hydrolase [Eubacterium sp.]